MELGFILGGLFVFLIIVFIAVAVFAPEWVGIQGKISQEIESSHRQLSDQEKTKAPGAQLSDGKNSHH